MAKKNRQPTAESAVKRQLRTEQYRMRVVKSKVAYRRKPKHAKAGESILKRAA